MYFMGYPWLHYARERSRASSAASHDGHDMGRSTLTLRCTGVFIAVWVCVIHERRHQRPTATRFHARARDATGTRRRVATRVSTHGFFVFLARIARRASGDDATREEDELGDRVTDKRRSDRRFDLI